MPGKRLLSILTILTAGAALLQLSPRAPFPEGSTYFLLGGAVGFASVLAITWFSWRRTRGRAS